MRIDPSGHDRKPAQIVIDWTGFRIDSHNLRALNDDTRVAHDVTFAVEQGSRRDHNALLSLILLRCVPFHSKEEKNDQNVERTVRRSHRRLMDNH